MQKLGITDSKQFIKRRFKEQGESLIFLQTCCVGKGIQDHIEAVIDETLISGTWIHTRVCMIVYLSFPAEIGPTLMGFPCAHLLKFFGF